MWTPEQQAEAIAILTKIVEGQFFELLDDERCVFCGEKAYIAWDYDPEGARFADVEFCELHHDETCPVGHAVRLVAGGAARRG